jgi:hypothetical protein
VIEKINQEKLYSNSERQIGKGVLIYFKHEEVRRNDDDETGIPNAEREQALHDNNRLP